MSILPLVRAEVRQLRAYDAAEQVDNTIRLNANESPHVSSTGVFRRPLNRYPEVRPQQLQSRMAKRFGCADDQILVTRGSSEAIDLIIRSFCRAGEDHIVTPTPAFSMYRHYATIQGAGVIEVPGLAERDFAVEVDALLEACSETTKVLFVCSPNNPTGTPLPRADLLRLLDERKATSAIVVDEAYIEFGRQHSAIELLHAYPNLLVLRTLSKALGFAGARCGAAIGAREIIACLSAVQAPYALATPVVECVEDALDERQLRTAAKGVDRIITERSRLMKAIAHLRFVSKVWPSEANFFLVRVDDAIALIEHCKSHNILLRYFGGDLSDCIRITVGSKSDNDILLAALDEFGKH
ncbi:MAG: histidinol-phosphate transaminase [Gammaproteobacteria bacterium]|nr:histidinol-phosphate transaminase [Gammaproteobacteria bacterium]